MNDHVEIFDGYLAELIKLQAEKLGKTPQEYVLSFFEIRCIAPSSRSASAGRNSFFP